MSAGQIRDRDTIQRGTIVGKILEGAEVRIVRSDRSWCQLEFVEPKSSANSLDCGGSAKFSFEFTSLKSLNDFVEKINREVHGINERWREHL